MTDDTATNPTPDTPAAEVATETADTEQAEQPESAEGDLQAADGEDGEDIEFDGQAYRVPKPLKEAFMRQADYTRKTQEVAAERTGLQTERQRIEADRQRFQQDTQAHGANLRDMSRLMNMGEQIDAYQKLDWAAIEQADSENGTQHAQRLFREQTRLQNDAQALAGQLQVKERERQSDAQRDSAKRRDEAQAGFVKEIPGWSNGMRDKARDLAISVGVTAENFDATTDLSLMKLARLAVLGAQFEKSQRAAVKGATPQRPLAAPVQQVAARRTPTAGPTDKDSPEEWRRKERARMAAVEAAGR